MSAIPANLQAVCHAVQAAALKAGRAADEVLLLAVSKTQPPAAVLEAVQAGQREFGENYVQEGVEKMLALAGLLAPLYPNGIPSLIWHFIGPLQSNKSRLVAEHFDWVHSIDRLKIAQRLSEQRPAHLPPLQVCVQVNVSGEASKSGCEPAEAEALCRAVTGLPRLRLRGLMAIPAPADDFESQRRPLALLRQLRAALQARGLALDTLSMGMSHDLEAAILEGSTLVRVGTAIFGART